MTAQLPGKGDSVQYRIGVASRMSGVAAHTLRKWEERYQLVAPTRTPTGERLYSETQVRYLSRLKGLVDAGMDISDLVGLSEEDLEAAEQNVIPAAGFTERESPPPRVTVIGRHMPEYLRQHGDSLARLSIERVFSEPNELEEADAGPTDLLICEQENVTSDTPGTVERLLSASGAKAVVVLYQFGSRWALHALRSSRVAVARMPVDPRDLQRLALGMWYEIAGWPSIVLGSEHGSQATPPRFSDATLMRVSSMSTAIRCECPHHIADLLMAVTSFEEYSATCEVEQPADAEEHRYLRATAASARMLFEDALVRLARAEGLSVEAVDER